MELFLRKANLLDKKITFRWLNDETVRQNSFSHEKTSYEDHESWFEKTLKNENRSLFICMNFMMPVGQIRLDYTSEDRAVISYMVDEHSRGEGNGLKMLRLIEREALKKCPNGLTLVGEVIPGNTASERTFENAGYVKSKESSDECLVFEKKIDASSLKNFQGKSKKARNSNFEILRLIAMMMVITLHYIGKGGLIAPERADIKGGEFLFWGLECLSLVCVNAYVLISGYFMVGKKFRLSRLVELWCQIFFYSVVVAAALVLVGIVPLGETLSLYKQFIFLPASMGHYWFATAYIMLYIISPFLAKAMEHMNQRTHMILMLVLLTPLCFLKSIIPYELAIDDSGVSFVWFIALFVVAGYIRLYGMSFIDTKLKSFLLYIFSAFGILCFRYVASALAARIPAINLYSNVTDYNFFFVFTGALGLFGLFKNMHIRDNVITRFLVRIAPYTFGVYLLHEHLLLRYRWLGWLKVSEKYGIYRVLHLCGCVLIIMAVGIIVDMIRKLVFDVGEKLIIWGLGIYYAKQEVWDYLIFGGLATVVNWVVYLLFGYVILVPFLGYANESSQIVASGIIEKIMLSFTSCASLSNILAWVAAVLFAYWTNRNFVFHSQVKGFVAVLREFGTFVAARIFSFVVEQVLFVIMLGALGLSDVVTKLLLSVVVIVLNYIFSKLIIFKSNK